MSQAAGRVVSILATVGAVLLFGLAVAIGANLIQQRFFCEHMDGPVATVLSLAGLTLLYLVHGQSPLLGGSWRSFDRSSVSARQQDEEGAEGGTVLERHPMLVSGSDLLGRGLKLFWARLPAIYATNLIVSLPVLALQLGAPTYMRGRLSPLPGGALLGGLLVGTLGYILQAVGTAATFSLVGGEMNRRQIGPREALGLISHRFSDLLKTAILYGLAVLLGLLFGGIPGLLFLAWYAVWPQVVVAEGVAGTRALRHSRELTRGCWGQVFGLVLAFLAMSFVVYGLMSGLGQVLPGVERVTTGSLAEALGPPFRDVLNYPNYAAVTILTYLLIGLVRSYQAVCFTLPYLGLPGRRGSVDGGCRA
jgi:hypothetical protein